MGQEGVRLRETVDAPAPTPTPLRTLQDLAQQQRMQARETRHLGFSKPAGLLGGAGKDQRSAAEGRLFHPEAALQKDVQFVQPMHEVHPPQLHPPISLLLPLRGQPLQLPGGVRRLVCVAEAVHANQIVLGVRARWARIPPPRRPVEVPLDEGHLGAPRGHLVRRPLPPREGRQAQQAQRVRSPELLEPL